MPDPTPNRPLWEVMHDAYLKCELSGPRGHLGFAAELRAIAEEASRRYGGNDPAISLIAWLELEADCAEAGE
jgi:hypothetical protein